MVKPKAHFHQQFPYNRRWVPRNELERRQNLVRAREKVDIALTLVSGRENAPDYIQELISLIHLCEATIAEFDPTAVDIIYADYLKNQCGKSYFGTSKGLHAK